MICLCVWFGAAWCRGGEWIRELGLDFTNHVGTGECWTCVCVAVVWVVWGVDRGLA